MVIVVVFWGVSVGLVGFVGFVGLYIVFLVGYTLIE